MKSTEQEFSLLRCGVVVFPQLNIILIKKNLITSLER